MYRGAARLEIQAAVEREGHTVGIIESVTSDNGSQRVSVRMRTAGELRQNDRYLPRRDAHGRVGFHVVPGGGEPLHAGAVVEAGFTPTQRTPARPAPAPASAPESRSVAIHERSRAGAPSADWYRGSAQDDLAAFHLTDESNFQSVSPSLRNNVLSLPNRARQLPPAEAVKFLEDEFRRFESRFEDEMADAYKNQDRQAIRQLRALRAKTDPMLRKLRNQASRAAFDAARP